MDGMVLKADNHGEEDEVLLHIIFFFVQVVSSNLIIPTS